MRRRVEYGLLDLELEAARLEVFVAFVETGLIDFVELYLIKVFQ